MTAPAQSDPVNGGGGDDKAGPAGADSGPRSWMGEGS